MTGGRRPVRLHWRDRPLGGPAPAAPTHRSLLTFAPCSPTAGEARLWCGDALDTLDHLLASGERADMVHLDPPFGSAAGYARRRTLQGRDRHAELRVPAYSDTDRGDIAAYLEALYPVLCRARDVLAAHGNLYLHIDYRRGPYLRLLLDEIFGADALLNEIVWAYALGGSTPTRYQRKHDTVFLYAREPGRHYFEAPREAATSSRLAGRPKLATDTWVTDHEGDGAVIERDWPDELVRKTVGNRDPERTGYGTQKPLALAARMVAASCPPGGWVVDPMCGSGTVGVAASLLGRRAWLGDRGEAALDVARSRLLHAGAGLTVGALGGCVALRPWPHGPLATVEGEVARLVPDALRVLAAEFPAPAADLVEAQPVLALGAWGVGRLRDHGAIAVTGFVDQARLRVQGPIGDEVRVRGSRADAAYAFDLRGRGWWAPL